MIKKNYIYLFQDFWLINLYYKKILIFNKSLYPYLYFILDIYKKKYL